ncbi:hypothetical protein [Actinomycetospora soli]|uniref:hypothetical protein n=1 Tax=Actinomycetospora soli TaxID=2893887 RepID=UPI001E569050|nr:hypothetical protein [Actinomycetospora soli]MCD2187858.1 hypothetical protein [Actinomycetospora soli]
MTVQESPTGRRGGLVVSVIVSLLAGVGLGLGLLTGAVPALPLGAGTAGPPLDLRAVDWGDATLPGSVCRSPGPIQLRGGQATSVPSAFDGPTPNYPQDVSVEADGVVYGDLTGDGRDEAALPLRCNNHDSTAAGNTVTTVLLFDGSRGQAALLGALASSQPRLGEIPNIITVRQLQPRRVVGDESFYGPEDANCCPSGRATTTWPWTGGTLGTPEAVVSQAVSTTPLSSGAATTPTATGAAPSSSSGGVDAEALAMSAARATPQLDQSRILAARCATKYLTVPGAAIGCGIRDAASRRVAMVEVMLVDLASRNVLTYVAVPGSGCPGLPIWAAKNIGDMEGDNPC